MIKKYTKITPIDLRCYDKRFKIIEIAIISNKFTDFDLKKLKKRKILTFRFEVF